MWPELSTVQYKVLLYKIKFIHDNKYTYRQDPKVL